MLLWELDERGERFDSITRLLDQDMIVRHSVGMDDVPYSLATPHPFSRGAFWTVGGDRLYAGSNDSYRFVARDVAGRPSLDIRVAGLERRIDASEVESVRRSSVERCGNEQCRENAERRLTDFPLPDVRPAFGDLAVDAAGKLWVAEYEPEGAPRSHWHVFSSEDYLLGRVTLPEGFQLEDAGEGFVLGIEEDELGVQYVRRYGLARAP